MKSLTFKLVNLIDLTELSSSNSFKGTSNPISGVKRKALEPHGENIQSKHIRLSFVENSSEGRTTDSTCARKHPTTNNTKEPKTLQHKVVKIKKTQLGKNIS